MTPDRRLRHSLTPSADEGRAPPRPSSVSPFAWLAATIRAASKLFSSLRDRATDREGDSSASPGASAARPVTGEDDRLRAVFEHSPVGIAILDRSFAIVHANAAFEHFLGYDLTSLVGRPVIEFATDDDRPATAKLLSEVGVQARAAGSVEARFLRGNQSIGWGALSVSMSGAAPDSTFVAVLQDVTERKTLEAQLVHEASHDPLTGLPNRVLFRDRVEHALTRTSRDPEQIAVIFLDLDNFKVVNDTQGHGAGDRLLQIVARRLLSATRGCDTVARIGGDEFAVLLEQLGSGGGAEAVLDRIVTALRAPAELETDRTVGASASMGIAFYSGEEGAEDLLRNADVAMYEAKLHSRGRWITFDPTMHVALIDRVTMEADLTKALERCQLAERPRLANTGRFPSFEVAPAGQTEFSVVYQPIVNLTTGRISALEALARWEHPQRGPVSPEAFIPVAERTGAITALGRWVLHEACVKGAGWNRSRPDDPITITVNLSGKQLEHEGVAAEVAAIVQDAGLAPQHLVLEITETVIMQNAESTLARLTELKRIGVRLAIDDFGTGYSSLSYLQRFPVELLKIDRVFTDALRQGVRDDALIRTILALAEMLSLGTVAEGIEDAEQCERLRNLGCTAGQGYLFGRPLIAAQVDALLAEPTLLPIATE